MITEADIKDIQAQITQAQSQKARATVERENAEKNLVAAKKRLKDEFGVESIEEITEKIKQLESQLEAEVASVVESLKESEDE